MKHNYIKNFKHLVNILNKTISKLEQSEINELGVGDDKFYYEYVYRMEYCDAFAYYANNVDAKFVTIKSVKEQYNSYVTTGYAYQKNYNKQEYIKISKEFENE